MGRIKDLTGRKFGRLTVLYMVGVVKEKHGAIWHCACDCGSETDVQSYLLSHGGTRSCGCISREREHGGRFKDLTGMIFGRLTVISFVKKDRFSHSIWHCKCTCGSEVDTKSSDLIRGITQSCGCYKSDRNREAHFKDLTGMIFGKLTVIEFAGMNKWGNSMWRCVCGCERHSEVVVASGSLIGKHTLSCGCYKIDRIKETHITHGQSKTKEYKYALVNKRRERKEKLDTEWDADLNRAIRRFFGACVVCGSGEHLQVDHVRPLSKGYGLRADNAVLLCRKCNSKKHAKMPSELPVEMRDRIEYASAAFWEYCANKCILPNASNREPFR